MRAEAAVEQAPPGNNGIVVSFLQNPQLMQEFRPDKQCKSTCSRSASRFVLCLFELWIRFSWLTRCGCEFSTSIMKFLDILQENVKLRADSEIMQLGSLNLCQSVIRSIETARNFDFEDFPVKDKVRQAAHTIYYTGRLELFNENFLIADQKLTYALLHCNSQSESNMRCVAKKDPPGKVQSALRDISYFSIEICTCSNVTFSCIPEKLELQVYKRLVKMYIIQR
ncbi:hypothetical protein EJB05_28012, partial [Eragrostis curvula]